MHEHPHKLVLVVVVGAALLLRYGLPLGLRDPLLRIALHVELRGKLEPVIHLHLPEVLVVELEADEVEGERVGQVLDARPLLGGHVLVALLALPLVVTVQNVCLDVKVQALENVALGLHLQAYREEVLRPVRLVRALRGDDLVQEGTSKGVSEHVLLGGPLDVRFHLVRESVEELVRILLPRQYDGLAHELHRAAKVDGVHEFGSALLHVSEEGLQLEHHALFLVRVLLCRRHVENVIPQRRDDEQLLQKRVHVTCAPLVLEPHIVGALCRPVLRACLRHVDVPVRRQLRRVEQP
mmetsp:Transcript_11960/g.33670  ORF Transcript_11960/g.33670 Transcript_11960/m.33670 type:complete len:295 (+) Transcript_11960:1781-2665(+)